MSIIKKRDFGSFLNFMPCNEGAGDTVSTVDSSNQLVISATASINWSTNLAVAFENIAANKAISSGDWDGVTAGSDWILMMLINMNDATIANFNIGSTASNHFISIGGKTAGILVKGATGTETMTSIGVTVQEIRRVLLTFDNASDEIKFYDVATGVAITSDDASATVGVASDAGDVTTIDANYSASTFGGEVLMYGMEMVEYANGLPRIDILLDRVNQTFTNWEAGRKWHFVQYEGDSNG